MKDHIHSPTPPESESSSENTQQTIPSSKYPVIKKKDLSVTALYTAHTWSWAKFEYAHIFQTDQTKAVFNITNLFLFFARIFNRKIPFLPHGLAQRHQLIDHLVHQSQSSQILELAAGLSSRGLRHIQSTPSPHYIEVDLDHVIEHKLDCLKQHDPQWIDHPSIQWISADLIHADLTQWLKPQSTCIIAEGLMMYLTAEQQKTLYQKVYTALRPQGGTFIFDLVPAIEQPKPGFLGKILSYLMKVFTGGKGFITDQRSREDIVQDLKQIGFSEVTILQTDQVADQYKLPYPTKYTQQVIFQATLPKL